MKKIIKDLLISTSIDKSKINEHSIYIKSSLKKLILALFANRLFAIMVVIPTCIYFLYMALIFTPRYESTASIAIKDNSSSVSFGGFQSLLGSSSGGTSNPFMLQKYILSINILNDLNKSIQLIKHYQSDDIDFISRLSSSANQKQQLNYYKSKVDVVYNQDSQSLDISAQGITPKEAQYILNGIIQASQSYVNNIDNQLATQRLDFAQKQVQLAQEKLTSVNESIANFQDSNNMLDPQSELAGLSAILADLNKQLIIAQTQLLSMQQIMQDSAADILRQKEKIATIQQEIEVQKQKILGLDGENKNKLNQVVSKFEWLRMQAQVAVGEYTAAIASLESAKSDVIKQKEQVVILQGSTLPNYCEYPRLWYNTFTLFIVSLMLYGILRMGKTIIDEHRY